MKSPSAYVLLEDGTRFDGDAVGAPGPVTGEVVFTTGMSGYQESMSDPSFARQLITFTYPHIGNYGVSAAGMESDRIHARAAIMRAAVNRADAPGAEHAWLDWLRDDGVPGIDGVDTRALVRHIRDAGAMRGGVFPGEMPESEARERIAAEPSMVGRRPRPRGDGRRAPRRRGEGSGPAHRRARHRHQALDRAQLQLARRDARAVPVHDDRRRSCWRATPTGSSSSPAPATRPRSATSSTRSAS